MEISGFSPLDWVVNCYGVRFMSKLELWFIKRIIKRQVLQGAHRRRIFNLYAMIVDAARDEFKEDNKPTLDSFLKEIHQEALDS